MTIKRLLALIIVPFFFVTGILVWQYFNYTYSTSFKKVESEYLEDQNRLIKKLISATSQRYLMLAQDWGAWDDAYNFINTQNTEFIKNNLDSSTLYTTDTDVLAYLNKDRRPLYSLAMPLYKKDVDIILKKISDRSLKGDSGYFFVRSENRKIFFVTYAKVTDSQMRKPYNGYFLSMLSMDKYLKNTFGDSGLEIKSLLIVPKENGTDANSKLNRRSISLTYDLPMMTNSSVIRLEFIIKRSLIGSINRMIDSTVTIIMLIVFLAAALVTLIMYYGLLRNISHITHDFSELANSPDFGVRLPVRGVAELKLLATTANKALDDITTLNKQLVTMSNVDGLTGISNRRFFDITLDKEIKASARLKSPIAMLMLDIDNFKHFNDTYGHLTGDECLKSVASAIAHTLKRPLDTVSRFGGEEFAVILPHTDNGGAFYIAEEIREAVMRIVIKTQACDNAKVTISIGVYSVVPSATASPQEFIHNADKALYAAKKTKNKSVLYTYEI